MKLPLAYSVGDARSPLGVRTLRDDVRLRPFSSVRLTAHRFDQDVDFDLGFDGGRSLVDLPTSTIIASVGDTVMTTATTTTTFEPVLPDTTTLVAMGSIVVLSVIAAAVWANSVVPVSRTKLAISKSRGEVKEYLDELKATAPSASTLSEDVDASVVDDADESDVLVSASTPDDAGGGGDDRALERWLFADWLRDNKSANQKPAAVPFLKKAKWNSGDNPVLVTSGMLLLCVVVASVTERIGPMGVR